MSLKVDIRKNLGGFRLITFYCPALFDVRLKRFCAIVCLLVLSLVILPHIVEELFLFVCEVRKVYHILYNLNVSKIL